MNICICGGGSLGHVLSGILSSNGHKVNLLTRQPEKWNPVIEVSDTFGTTYLGNISKISSSPSEVIPQSDVVLLCLPGFAIPTVLQEVAPFVNTPESWIGSIVSSTGFFYSAYRILSKKNKLFGFQRVPFISKIEEYGKKAIITGYKKEAYVATVNACIQDRNIFITELSSAINTRIVPLNHFLEASISNSNPLLHPVRLYSLFKDWNDNSSVDHIPQMYITWDDKSSEILIDCDSELQKVIANLPIKITPIPPLLDYYESYDASSLSKKLRSIEAFKDVPCPMVCRNQRFFLDINHRYFREDFPFGLLLIKCLADYTKTQTPTIDKILDWGQKIMHKKYIVNHQWENDSLLETGYISQKQIDEMLNKA